MVRYCALIMRTMWCANYAHDAQGVNVNARYVSGDTARSLALVNGHTKIVSLIDNHVAKATAPPVGGASASGRRAQP